MTVAKEIKALVWKEFLLEWKQKYALNGIILYTVSTIFVCYISFNVKNTGIGQFTWNALFWIIILFSSTSAISKSFVQEGHGRLIYYYSLVRPQSIIASKIIYNTFLLTILCILAVALYAIVLGYPIQDQILFFINLLLGSVSLSTALTLVSSIASKAGNSGILMAILSFPIMIPIILLVIQVSKNAIDGLERSFSFDELATLFAINLIVSYLSFVLFPFVWRS